MNANSLEYVYNHGTFGVDRRRFLQLASAAGVAAVGGALLVPEERHAHAEETTSALPTLEDGKVRFTVHSDVHVGAGGKVNYRAKFAHAFDALYGMSPSYAGHFFVGDLVETANRFEFDELVELVNAHISSPIVATMGNHEYYRHGDDGEAARAQFADEFLSRITVPNSPQAAGGEFEGQADVDVVIGGDGTEGSGYHVICVSAHSEGNVNFEYYGDRKDWIREHLASAAAEGAEKPIFLLTHHPFDATVRLSGGDSWVAEFGDDPTQGSGTDHSFYEELCEQYPQIIHFAGHTHTPFQDPLSIYQDDGMTNVQTSTFTCDFMMYTTGFGYDDSGVEVDNDDPKDGYNASQCAVVEIDPQTNVVTIYRIDFRDDSVVGEPWVVDPAQPVAERPYTSANRADLAKDPLVGAGANELDAWTSLSTSSWGTSEYAYFSVNAENVRADASGAPDDVVVSYAVTVTKDGEEDPVYDARFIADYYKTAISRPATYVRRLFGISLDADTDYTVSVSALTAYGRQAEVGSVTLHTDGAVEA